MSETKGSLGFYIIVLIVGAVIGTVLGEVIGSLIPKDGIIHDFFVTGVTLGITKPLEVDLKFFALVVGLTIKLTVSSVIGILIAAVIMRKV
ncbi:MAG: DUF4321 domain-containing protein [Candidatus Firestonebacteria bacterium]